MESGILDRRRWRRSAGQHPSLRPHPLPQIQRILDRDLPRDGIGREPEKEHPGLIADPQRIQLERPRGLGGLGRRRLWNDGFRTWRRHLLGEFGCQSKRAADRNRAPKQERSKNRFYTGTTSKYSEPECIASPYFLPRSGGAVDRTLVQKPGMHRAQVHRCSSRFHPYPMLEIPPRRRQSTNLAPKPTILGANRFSMKCASKDISIPHLPSP